MTYIESPVETITRFVSSWQNTPDKRLEEEIISSFNETSRKPDEYKFKFKDGKLVDYQTEIEISINRSTYLGKMDAGFLDTLTAWVSENNSGTALWISPSFESSYPCNKVSIYKIEIGEDGTKTTFNTSVLFDSPKQHTLEIASKLNSAFKDLGNPEVLRNKLFSIDEDFGLSALLELIGTSQNFPPTPSLGVIKYFVQEIHSGRDPRSIAQEMQQSGLIGEHSVSCAGGANTAVSLGSNSLEINFGGMEDQFGSLYFNCPKCGATNTRPFGQLISDCQHCGGDVRC